MGVVIPNLLTEDRVSSSQIIDGGLRFGGDTPQHYLTRTTSTPTNAKIFTFSCWFKRSLLDSGVRQFISNSNGANDRGTYIGIESDAFIAGVDDDSTGTSFRRTSSGLIRDSSSWYHLVWVYDTTQSTTDAAIKIYLNGVRFDTTSAGTYSQNYESRLSQSGKTIYIGSGNRASSSYTGRHWNGFMSQVYFIDGQALDPSYFGFTDPLTNTWRPKKLSSSVAFGTNGFYLPFDGNSPIGQDCSGRGNNWTPVNFGGSNTIEKATGALPILNTDGGGKVARVGVRTDSFVGAAATCILALPLVGIKSDFSNQVDSRSTNNAVSVNNGGPVASTEQSNFYGGSFKFDGTDDYLTVGSAADWKFLNDGTPWTIEFWYYVPTGNYGYLDRGLIFANTAGTIGSGENGIAFYYISSALRCGFVGGPNSNASYTSYTFPKNKWVHVAGVFDGSKVKLYVDGVEVASTSNLTGFNTGNPTATLNIGRTTDSYYYNTGYVQDYRIYKGAKYTQNFIPASTDPDILPDTPSGVSYSSNVKKITDGAVAFDGNGDYLSLSASADFGFSTPSGNSNDFTIEWFKYWTSLTSYQTIWSNNYVSSPGLLIQTGNGDGKYRVFVSSGTEIFQETNAPTTGKWYHYALVRNGTTYTLYRDGIANGSATSSSAAGSGSDAATIGQGSGSYYENGFISNFHLVKGTALYTSNFTPPTAPITSVANTKLLCCKSNSSATVFDVSPGTITANGNAAASNFNPFNTDINTVRGQESGYATLNPLSKGSDVVLSNGNLNVIGSTDTFHSVFGTTQLPSTGKWYFEFSIIAHTVGYSAPFIGVCPQFRNETLTTYIGAGTNEFSWDASGSSWLSGTQTVRNLPSVPGDVMQFAVDVDTGKMWGGVNNIWAAGGNPSTSSNPLASSSAFTSVPLFIAVSTYGTQGSGSINFGQKPFKFPPPEGFQPLALANTPRPTIVRPDQYVGIVTYTGNGATRSLNVGFKPDFSYFSVRSGTGYVKYIFDSVRGATKYLATSGVQGDDAEGTDAETLKSFDFNGVTIGNNAQMNESSANTWVSWHWKAGGNSNTFNINDIGYSSASAAGLTAGTITPTGASVNTKSGFSIIKWNGSGASGTLSHGLGNTPGLIFLKGTSAGEDGQNWRTYHSVLGTSPSNTLFLNLSNASSSNTERISAVGTSTFTLSSGGAGVNASGQSYIAYIWAEIPGFSKFGSYTGNGSGNVAVDGPFINCNFRPAWILIKCTTSSQNWYLADSNRNKFNGGENTKAIQPNSNVAERNAEIGIDFLSNGFKLRHGEGAINNSGDTYIYAAFAESPSFNLYGGQSNAR